MFNPFLKISRRHAVRTLAMFGVLFLASVGSAQATFISALTSQSVVIGGDGVPDVDITLLVVGSESGFADFTINTANLLPFGQSFTSQDPIDVTLRVQAYDDGGSPPVVDFSKVTWSLLDANGATDNTADDYFFDSVVPPAEVTAFMTNPPSFNTGPTYDSASFDGGLLTSTNPATEAVFFSRIHLDTSFNVAGASGLDLDMRVSLEADGATSVPLPSSLWLFSAAVIGMRKRITSLS